MPLEPLSFLSYSRKDYYPQERAERARPGQSLAPARNWRTLTAFAVHLIVWYVALVGAA